MREAAIRLQELDALVRLLDDPDPVVHAAVQGRLKELGRAALPGLRLLQETVDEAVLPRLEAVCHELHFGELEQAWALLMQDDDPDLEAGALLIALYGNPDLDLDRVRARLDGLARELDAALGSITGLARGLRAAELFGSMLGFSGNRDAYYCAENSYLDQVIASRRGIPVSLSVVFLLLARRLALPFYGVNTPAHFLVKYEDSRHEVFVDLYNGNHPISREDVLRFLLRAGVRARLRYFAAATNRAILLRMVRNLLAVAEANGQERRRLELQQLLSPWDHVAG